MSVPSPSIIQTRGVRTGESKNAVPNIQEKNLSSPGAKIEEIEVQEGEAIVHQEVEMTEDEGPMPGISPGLRDMKDSQVNVQIIASGDHPAKRAKTDTGEEYLIMEQHEIDESEALEAEENDSSQQDNSTELDILVRTSSKKLQKYRKQWEDHPSLKNWLTMVPGNQYRAWCRQCGCPLITQLKVLLDHGRCRKHLRREGRALQEPPHPTSIRVGLGGTLGAWGRRESSQLDVSYGDSDRVTYSIGLGSQKVGFIGAGKIAQAIAMGMMNKGLTSSSCIMVSAPTERNTAIWKRWKCKTLQDNSALVNQCDVVFVCVAPAHLETVVAGLEPPGDGAERCFISTVSGVSQEKLTQMMAEVMPDEQVFVIRCVLSKTVAIGEGVCVYSTPHDLPHTWLLTMETMFSALGLCQKVDEHVMNVHSGAFSSGPAYVAAFIDALAAGAANHGVRWEDAIQMAAQVTQGTAAMILTQGVSPATVRHECSAAGGHTIAGMMALHKAGLEFAVMSAVDEATKKSKELGADELQ